MSGITLEIAEAKLAMWLDAESALATSQSYTIEENNSRRVLTRADLSAVRDSVKYWNTWCQKLSPSRRKSGYGLV